MYFMVNENLPSHARRRSDQMGRYAALNAKKGKWKEALCDNKLKQCL